MTHSFTLIICTYNRCQNLKVTFESLIKQECDWDSVAEIIVVDNNSKDGTAKLIDSYASSFKTKLIHLKELQQGKSYALNLAIKESQGDVLAFTDDDVILDAHWLDEIIRFFNTNEVDVLGGRVLPEYPSQTPQWVKDNQYNLRGPIVSYDLGEDIIAYHSGKITDFIGANVIYRKNVFDKVGLYNTDLGVGRGTLSEDTEMFARAVKAGERIFYNGKALVWHPVVLKRLTLSYIAKWNYQHGKSTAFLDPVINKQEVPTIAGIPRHLYKCIFIKFFELTAILFDPRSFFKKWCSFYYNLGMFIGYAKGKHQ